MEETSQDSVSQTDANSVPTEKKPEIQSDNTDKYRRDMFRYKDENKELKDRLRDLELVDEQKKGNLEGVITSLKDEIKTLKNTNATDRYEFSKTNLDSAIRQEVLSKGISSEKADVFMKLVNDDDKGAVELDASFNVNQEDIKNLVDKNMERYSSIGLFNKKVNIVDATPVNNNPNVKAKMKSIKDMTWDEATEYVKTLK